MSPVAFDTVNSVMSPVDASTLSGRYETAVEVNGKTVQVLRSIRQCKEKELLIRGSLTPTPKKKKHSAADLDDLCESFQSKVKVTPSKKKPGMSKAGQIRQARKKAEEPDSVKENLGKERSRKSLRFSESSKKASVTPVTPVRRSSRRLSMDN